MLHIRLLGLPPSWMNARLPMRGSLGGPGGKFLGFLELKTIQAKMTEIDKTIKVHILREQFPNWVTIFLNVKRHVFAKVSKQLWLHCWVRKHFFFCKWFAHKPRFATRCAAKHLLHRIISCVAPPPRGTRNKNMLLRIEREEKSSAGFEPMTSWLWGMCSTAVLLPLPEAKKTHKDMLRKCYAFVFTHCLLEVPRFDHFCWPVESLQRY